MRAVLLLLAACTARPAPYTVRMARPGESIPIPPPVEGTPSSDIFTLTINSAESCPQGAPMPELVAPLVAHVRAHMLGELAGDPRFTVRTHVEGPGLPTALRSGWSVDIRIDPRSIASTLDVAVTYADWFYVDKYCVHARRTGPTTTLVLHHTASIVN